VKATYKYLADGTKLTATADTIVVSGSSISGEIVYKTVSNGFEYLGSMVYTRNVIDLTLESTSFGGGRINKTTSGFDINYFITDHLGSTRAIVDANGGIKEQKDYYPFGEEHENPNLMSSTNRYLFSGKEKQTIRDLNYLDFGARMLNHERSPTRWMSIDPLCEKYYSISPYAYCANNPVNSIDPNGMELLLFKNGVYVGSHDDGKKEITGYNQRSTVNEDGTEEFTGADNFSFNDPDADAQAVKNGKITNLEFMSDSKLESMIDASGVKTTVARNSSWNYAYNQGKATGKMDYGWIGANSKELKKNTFYVRENIAYNIGDIGNYIWGRGMAELGIALPTARLGAHVNNMLFGRRQHTNAYDFGDGTYGPPGFFDSDGDQRAIVNGYLSSPEGRKWLEIHKRQKEKAMAIWNKSFRTSFSIY
jgi:RHS repeat-associated protein